MSIELSFVFPTYDEDQNIFERFDEREKELKTELKAIGPANKKV